MKFFNPFDLPGRWYKANFHCHSTLSDGDVSPGQRVRQYKEKGYDILAITDHRVASPTRDLSSDDFLTLCGTELHPNYPHIRVDTPHHLVCLNVPEGFSMDDEIDANEVVRRVNQLGGAVIYAHPYRYGHTINHLTAVHDYAAIEVYNASGWKVCKELSSVHWDDLLLDGRRVGAVAVDDIHSGPDIFLGWTWIKSEQLNPESVIQALRDGAYYASTGPIIEDFRVENGVVSIKCSPCREIRLIGQCEYGKLFRANGDPLEEVSFELWEGFQYLRAEVRDENGRTAWTNPVFFGR